MASNTDWLIEPTARSRYDRAVERLLYTGPLLGFEFPDDSVLVERVFHDNLRLRSRDRRIGRLGALTWCDRRVPSGPRFSRYGQIRG